MKTTIKIASALVFSVALSHAGVLPVEFKGASYGDQSEVEWNFGDGNINSSSVAPVEVETPTPLPIVVQIPISGTVVGASYGVNIARLATVTASSTYGGSPAYSPARINDGSILTTAGPNWSWTNGIPLDGVRDDQYVLLDFGASKAFSAIDLYTSEGWPISDYNISVWNGTTWTVLIKARKNTAILNHWTFAKISASKIKITVLKGPSNLILWGRINEVVVY